MTDFDSPRSRGQLSLTMVEVAVGAVLVVSVLAGFALGPPPDDPRAAQLDAYAGDAARILQGDAPVRGGETRLSAVSRSRDSFEREYPSLVGRLEDVLPAGVLYRVETRHGSLGYPIPADGPLGRTVVSTPHGDVTIRVWYA